jgi:4-amino-4-deoxy-L-arabinose transferase-like glycosyltransferase
VLTAIVALLLALWIPVHLSFPLGRDQAIIARVTQVMLDGGWPYVDAWDHKGPAAYLLYAPALALLGPPEIALYRADLLLLGGLFFAYRAIATRLDLPLAGPLALLVLILCVRNGHWSFAQPDTWIGYLAVAAAALLLGPRSGTRSAAWLAVGFAIGFATMVKPLFAGFLVLPATALATLPAAQRPRLAILATALGFSTAIAAVVLPFVMAGKGGALWEAYIAFNLGGHATRTWQDAGEWLQRFFGTFLVPRMHLGMTAILIAAAFGFRMMLRRHRRVALVLASGWAVALIGVAVQGKAFPYHFMAVHGFTAAFAGAFVAERVARDVRGGTPSHGPARDPRPCRRDRPVAGDALRRDAAAPRARLGLVGGAGRREVHRGIRRGALPDRLLRAGAPRAG